MNSSQRSTQARKLLSSIEKHIGKLIQDKPDSFVINSFEQSSNIHSPNNSFNIPPQSPMNIFQLQSSIPKSNNIISERVSVKINKMQQFYIQKIKKLQYQICSIQQQNLQLKNKIYILQNNLIQSKQNTARIILQFQASKNQKMNELSSLHIHALQQFKTQLLSKLNQQKLLRINMQDKLHKLNEQNNYYKLSHKQISQNYRKLLQLDMSRIKQQIDQQNIIVMKRQIASVKNKTLKLRRKSKVIENVIPQVEKEIKAIRKQMREL